MIDKYFCLSSYLAFRYIWKDNIDFYEGLKHENLKPIDPNLKTSINDANDIIESIQSQIGDLYQQYDNIGILLSGGMDSAIVASFLKPGSHAFTFTSQSASVFDQDKNRATRYCKLLGLSHHLVDISMSDYNKFTPLVMKTKASPVHSIEPQIYKASIEAKKYGVECVLIGDGADYVFGGMDKLLSIDWQFDDFIKRYYSIDPHDVLKKPVDMKEPFEPYRLDSGQIDFLGFMDNLCTNESYSSYNNAFKTAAMPYYDPYERMVMSNPLDLSRVRNGESKYLIREAYKLVYPDLPIPEKIPMPRPVDSIFENWEGPTRYEFRDDIPMETLTGNQKWQLWCAQMFLDINEPLR